MTVPFLEVRGLCKQFPGVTAVHDVTFGIAPGEVLYGPQGTAFGRGTIGGAINYVTKKPTEDFEAELEGEVGSHPDGLVRGLVNGSLTGDRRLMARLVAFGGYDDGFIDTPNIGGSVDDQNYGARLSLRSQPTDRLALDLSGSFDRTEFRAPNQATLESIDGDGDLEFLIDRDGDNQIDRPVASFRAIYDADFGSLISNSAFVNNDSEGSGDFDLTEGDFLFGSPEVEDTTFSEEFRFETDAFDAPVFGETSFVSGVSGTWAEEERTNSVIGGALGGFVGIPPGSEFPFPSTTEEVLDLGVFGEVRFRPVERLELAFGGRFTFNEIEFTQQGEETLSKTFSAFTPRVSALYNLTDTLSTQALVSTDSKSGGFNPTPLPTGLGRGFDNETAINYEAGFRTRLLDDRLLVNASVLALFYDDIQVSVDLRDPSDPANIVNSVQDAAEARSLGIELQVGAEPIDDLQLDLAYGYTDAKSTDFADAVGGDATDQQLPNAPKHTLSLIGDYQWPLALDVDGLVRGEYSFTSSFGADIGVNRQELDAYDVLNLRVGTRGDRFELELFAENVLDERYETGFSAGGTFRDFFPNIVSSEPVEVGAGRRFGIRGRVRL